MANLKERLDRRSERSTSDPAHQQAEQPVSDPDRHHQTDLPSVPSPSPDRGLDEIIGSVEPTAGTYLARRAIVAATAILLVAIGAVGGRQVLRTGSLPTAALTVPQDDISSAVPPPISAPAVGPPPTEAPAPEVITPVANPLPDGASRLVPLDPTRILDTGKESTIGRRYTVDLETDWQAVALSITLAAPADSGSVLVDGGSGAIEAIAIDGPGQATTNLVVLPVATSTLSAWSTAGGRVIIDLVGGFEASAATDAGRFVPVDPTEITRLTTELEGREADLPLKNAVPIHAADAVLVVIGADVGADGGVVRFGPAADAYDQQLMWGPATGDRQRRGLVLLRPNELGEAHLRYEGGSELSAHVVGYFTDENHPVSTAGLYLPSGPRRLHEGALRPDEPVVVDGLEPLADTALVTVSSTSTTPGLLGSYLVPVTDGQVRLTPSTEVDSVVTLLGVFLGEIQ